MPATVDQLSHGRLIFGVGRSGVAQTHEAYGVSYAESRDRFHLGVTVIRATGFATSHPQSAGTSASPRMPGWR